MINLWSSKKNILYFLFFGVFLFSVIIGIKVYIYNHEVGTAYIHRIDESRNNRKISFYFYQGMIKKDLPIVIIKGNSQSKIIKDDYSFIGNFLASLGYCVISLHSFKSKTDKVIQKSDLLDDEVKDIIFGIKNVIEEEKKRLNLKSNKLILIGYDKIADTLIKFSSICQDMVCKILLLVDDNSKYDLPILQTKIPIILLSKKNYKSLKASIDNFENIKVVNVENFENKDFLERLNLAIKE